MKLLNKKISIILFVLMILVFFGLEIHYGIKYLSEIILSITVVVIFWYTHETMGIRKSEEEIARNNNELLSTAKIPTVHFNVFHHTKKRFDTRFKVINSSKYPVSVRVKFIFRINGNIIDHNIKGYNGRLYWNLQQNEIKEGHFGLLQVISKTELFTEDEIAELKDLHSPDLLKRTFSIMTMKYDFGTWPRLLLDVEVFCENEFKEKTYYPDSHFEYDFKRLIWIPTITSEIPYWEYENRPSWTCKQGRP
jgi:hypothetical protein